MRVGCLYLPNGNPAPGPKFDYKLRWFTRLTQHADSLLATVAPVVLAGDYNVRPTDLGENRGQYDEDIRPSVMGRFKVSKSVRSITPPCH